jgi:hypothetical protein
LRERVCSLRRNIADNDQIVARARVIQHGLITWVGGGHSYRLRRVPESEQSYCSTRSANLVHDTKPPGGEAVPSTTPLNRHGEKWRCSPGSIAQGCEAAILGGCEYGSFYVQNEIAVSGTAQSFAPTSNPGRINRRRIDMLRLENKARR